jgi:hypothetical protein
MHFTHILRHIVMCVLSGRTTFRYVISGMTQFSKKKKKKKKKKNKKKKKKKQKF